MFDNISLLTLIILYQDINDHGPMFNQSHYTFSVYENVNVGYVVGTLLATDRDEGANAQITYRLISSNAPFILDGNNPGNIIVNGQLVREDDSQYTLYVNG